MAQHWTSQMARRMNTRVNTLGRVFRIQPHPSGSFELDADARRLHVELDAIRTRFPDHA
jgi:hypothetical protein